MGIGGSVLFSTLRGESAQNHKKSNEYFTAAVFGLIWVALAVFAPNLFVRIFMTPTEEILTIAPGIIRSYGISFLLLSFNIFSTYYFQALMRPKASFVVSVSRGAVISGILICILPAVAGVNAIWFAMPVTIYVTVRMVQYTTLLISKGARAS